MRFGETDPDKMHAGGIPVFDTETNGFATGQTFVAASSQVLVSFDGAAPVQADNNATEIAYGLYDYVFSADEAVSAKSYIIVFLVKTHYLGSITIAIDDISVEGLLHNNSMVDGGAGATKPTYDGSIMTSWRVRHFATAADISSATLGAADDADNEIARWTGVATASGGKMALFKMTRVL